MSNDSEHYDLDDPQIEKAWEQLNSIPTFLLKRLLRKAKKDMLKKKSGATGTYFMCKDILWIRKHE